MATLEINLANDVEDSLQGIDYQSFYRRVGDIYEQSIKSLSSRGADPDGSARLPLNQTYAEMKAERGKSPIPDSRNEGIAMATLVPRAYENGVRFVFASNKASEYMFENEYGIGVPQRRLFPVEKGGLTDSAGQSNPNFNDTTSSPQVANQREVATLFAKHVTAAQKEIRRSVRITI